MSNGYWVANVGISDLEEYKKYVAANAVPFRKYGAPDARRKIGNGRGQIALACRRR
jgi:uncharacterized protein (DUF1330 family)